MNKSPQKLSLDLPLSLVTLTFLASFFVLYFFMNPIMVDPDVSWHLANGQDILARGEIIKTEIYSFTNEGHDFYNSAWLWDIIAGGVVNVTGLSGFFTFSVFMYSSLIALLAFLTIKRGESSQDPFIIAMAIAFMAISVVAVARPTIITYMMVALFHYITYRGKKDNSNIIFTLPLLNIIWVNMHGGFIFGIVIIGAFLFEALHDKNYQFFKKLLSAFILTILAILVNPDGWKIFYYIYVGMQSETIKYIGEWQPFQFEKFTGFDVLLIILFLAINFSSKRISLAEKLLVLFWFVASMHYIRNFPILAIISAPIVAIALEESLPNKSQSEFLRRVKNSALVVLVAIISIGLIYSPLREKITDRDRVVDEKIIPIESLAFIKKEYPDLRFANDYAFGGYFVYYNRDVQKVFVDGRAGIAYDEKFLKEYLKLFGGEDSEIILDKYKIEGVILKKKNPEMKIKELVDAAKWTKVFEGKVADVYIRADKAL